MSAETTRAAIDEAVGAWVIKIADAAQRQQALPIIENVGIPAIDNALPFLKSNNGDARKARYDFLIVFKYLLGERHDAMEVHEYRKAATKKAEALICEAAALMDCIDNPQLATLLYSIADHAKTAQSGCIYPKRIYAGNIAMDDTPDKRVGVLLDAHFVPDALTGNFAGKRGGKSRDANIVKAIAQRFPDSQKFLSASEGYSIIAGLAVLCGLGNKNPKQYVRETLLGANKGTTKAEEPQPRRDTSIAALLTGNKPT